MKKAYAPSTPAQRAIVEALPGFFKRASSISAQAETHKFEGSYGLGNMALCPWVGIFDRRITESARNGYYIVLLFAENMKGCYLSLNQGYSQFREAFHSEALALQKSRDVAREVAMHLSRPIRAQFGPIDLGAKGGLGKGYEQAAIVSYYYPASELPDERQLSSDFVSLLNLYNEVYKFAGLSLIDFAPVVDNDYQDDAIQAALEMIGGAPFPEEKRGVEPPPAKSRAKTGAQYCRDSRKAAAALLYADFKCELDVTHTSFTAKKTGRPYVEAHHLIPMSAQPRFEVSLDVTGNIVALCPNCHRMLHHATPVEKKSALRSLLLRRQAGLTEKGIVVNLTQVIAFYSQNLDDD
ncbi:MrcB family domain-containing protein [Caballeronia sp. Sq4a]|uniref:MrcB family domain-containing protein n=1 Tax=Caballeronia sp. Sq4a TaxID=2878152 RepID=UPI002738203A|nr:DUF3578 domain-containing protein [Caballeronia sp. Sq4a]